MFASLLCVHLLAVAECAVQDASSDSAPQPPLEITYVRNEGFLLTAGDDQVLIDALFRRGVAQYGTIPKDLLGALEKAEAPYDGIDVLLFSHFHPDHFEAPSAGAHLQHNEGARLVSSTQVVEALRKGFREFDSVAERVTAVELGFDDAPKRVEIGDIAIEMRRLGHGKGRESVHNLGQLIELGGYRIMHFGDLGEQPAEFLEEELAKIDLDVALFPYWYFLETRRHAVLREGIAPEVLVPVHIPPAQFANVEAKVRIHFPEAVLFEEPLETRRYHRVGEDLVLLPPPPVPPPVETDDG